MGERFNTIITIQVPLKTQETKREEAIDEYKKLDINFLFREVDSTGGLLDCYIRRKIDVAWLALELHGSWCAEHMSYVIDILNANFLLGILVFDTTILSFDIFVQSKLRLPKFAKASCARVFLRQHG